MDSHPPAAFHEYVACPLCGWHSRGIPQYELHLATEHQFPKRKRQVFVGSAMMQHSICRKCWNTRLEGKKTLVQEVPQRLREGTKCCFCGETHRDGLVTHPLNRPELLCYQAVVGLQQNATRSDD